MVLTVVLTMVLTNLPTMVSIEVLTVVSIEVLDERDRSVRGLAERSGCNRLRPLSRPLSKRSG